MLLATGLMLGSCRKDQPATDAARLQRVEELYSTYRAAFPEVPDITPTALQALSNQLVVLVDVRTPSEQAVSTLPGALTREAFEADSSRYKEHLVVAYCTIGARSGVYAASLRKRGLNAVNLAGSILAWAHEGYTLLTATGATKAVHVYGATWDLLPEGYTAVW